MKVDGCIFFHLSWNSGSLQRRCATNLYSSTVGRISQNAELFSSVKSFEGSNRNIRGGKCDDTWRSVHHYPLKPSYTQRQHEVIYRLHKSRWVQKVLKSGRWRTGWETLQLQARIFCEAVVCYQERIEHHTNQSRKLHQESQTRAAQDTATCTWRESGHLKVHRSAHIITHEADAHKHARCVIHTVRTISHSLIMPHKRTPRAKQTSMDDTLDSPFLTNNFPLTHSASFVA